MKKVFLLLLCVLCLFSLSSCGIVGNTFNYPRCVSHVQGHLKKPLSMIVKDAEGWYCDGDYVYIITIKAKNSFNDYSTDSYIVYADSYGDVGCEHCEYFYSYLLYDVATENGYKILY